MAIITIPTENRNIEGVEEIRNFLAPHGIWFERWPLGERVDPNAPPEDILSAYDSEIKALMAKGGFVVADVVNITLETPNLEPLLDRFRAEHTHSEDEVRFILRGNGLFHVHPDNGPVFAIQVTAGDMINVPKGTKHWFDLCKDRTIRAIRLFQETAGWTPLYVEQSISGEFVPLCFGPQDVAGLARPTALKIKS
ncbi:MAG: cupin domain-containing protein [Gemmataceae bacterium]|nr:cupin domain-containing protein [Gemmataceae bacterium]